MMAMMATMAGSAAERGFCELVRRLAPRPARASEGPLDALDAQVRFVADVGYANPGREVVRVRRRQGRYEVSVNRYVLAGLFGPLPEPYQELAARRRAAGDGATAAFLDVFNHRLNLLRFWVLARHVPGLAAQSPARAPLVQLVVGLVEGVLPGSAAMAGLAAPAHGLRPEAFVGLAGLLRHRDRSVAVLERVLRNLLPHELSVRPFAGGWVPRRADSYSRLGQSTSRLGETSVLGSRVWEAGKGIELWLTCATQAALEALLPGGDQHDRLCGLLRWLTQQRFDVHVVCLPPAEVPTGRLPQPAVDDEGAHAVPRGGPRLGYTARLGSRERVPGPPATVRFTIPAEEPGHAVA